MKLAIEILSTAEVEDQVSDVTSLASYAVGLR